MYIYLEIYQAAIECIISCKTIAWHCVSLYIHCVVEWNYKLTINVNIYNPCVSYFLIFQLLNVSFQGLYLNKLYI